MAFFFYSSFATNQTLFFVLFLYVLLFHLLEEAGPFRKDFEVLEIWGHFYRFPQQPWTDHLHYCSVEWEYSPLPQEVVARKSIYCCKMSNYHWVVQGIHTVCVFPYKSLLCRVKSNKSRWWLMMRNSLLRGTNLNRFKYIHVKEICAASQNSLKYKCENSFRYSAGSLHVRPYCQVPGRRSQPARLIYSAFCWKTPKTASLYRSQPWDRRRDELH